MHLSGLAISGGGIRSATFALGMLQGLAELDLLKRFDYISTVSGAATSAAGSPPGPSARGTSTTFTSSFASGAKTRARPIVRLCPRAPTGSSTKSPSRSTTFAPTAATSLLVPDSFHADTWSLIAIYARNLLINFLILLPATVFVVTLVRLACSFSAPHQELRRRARSVGLVDRDGQPRLPDRALARLQRDRHGALQDAGGAEPQEIAMRPDAGQGAVVARCLRSRRSSPPSAPSSLWNGLVWTAQGAWALPLLLLGAHPRFQRRVLLMAQYKLRTKTKPPIGIYRLFWYIIVPLIVSAVLSCWLFSIDPTNVDGDVVVKTESSRTEPASEMSSYPTPAISRHGSRLGYKVLIAPFDPPAFLADQARRGADEDYEQNALKGWEAGSFYWWPALHGRWVLRVHAWRGAPVHQLGRPVRLLADNDYVQNSPPFSLSRIGMALPSRSLRLSPVRSVGCSCTFWSSKGSGAGTTSRTRWSLSARPWPCSFHVSAALEIGLLGRRLEEDEREWWARVGALVLLAATFWVLLFVAVLYVPWLIELAGDDSAALGQRRPDARLARHLRRRCHRRPEPVHRQRQTDLQHAEGAYRPGRPVGLPRRSAGRRLDAGGFLRRCPTCTPTWRQLHHWAEVDLASLVPSSPACSAAACSPS